MSAIDWTVRVGDEATSTTYEQASTGTDAAVFVCAHGAGGKDAPFSDVIRTSSGRRSCCGSYANPSSCRRT
ncbi:MAG: hypothetical protein O2973_11570 [Gemmatimonadetes bacterium]|nr:hypothetical protein [Gemmatimonadota bacterium]